MDQSSYNSVVRTNSPFTPSTPSGNPSYKVNVNRTKTRKWVEAKKQNYDGDDWGGDDYDDYDDYDDEPEPAPPKPAPAPAPAPAIASRPAPPTHSHSGSGLLPSQRARTFSQTSHPVAAPEPAPASAPAPTNLPPPGDGPPTLHLLTEHVSPLLDTSQPTPPDVTPRSGLQSDAAASQSPGPGNARADALGVYGAQDKGSSNASSAGPSAANEFSPGEESLSVVRPAQSDSQQSPHGPSPRLELDTTAPAENKQNAGPQYGSNPASPPSATRSAGSALSAGDSDATAPRRTPKLPEMSRMSGFGDNFFSSQPRYSSIEVPPLPANAAELASTPPLSDGPKTQPQYSADSPTLADTKSTKRTSIIDGPKLDGNPSIRMPPPDSPASSTLPSQSARPQLPGTWISESSNFSPDVPTPMERAQQPSGLAQVESAGDIVQGEHGTGPADPEPTTKVKQLSSAEDDNEGPGGEFGDAVGKHDEAVAASAMASGPGHHPGGLSLPPLHPPMSSTHGEGQLDPDGTARKSTLSTVGTGSPVKESDVLREEIMRSLSPTGVDDEDSSPPENKSLREMGQEARKQSGSVDQLPSTAYQQDGSVTPIAPLTTKRPSDAGPRQRRFSWEQEPEPITPKPAAEPPRESSPIKTHATVQEPVIQQPAALVSNIVSIASSQSPETAALQILEPPSPMSDLHDDRSLSLGSEKHDLGKPPSAAADPREVDTTPVPSATQPVKIMAFKDIANLTSVQDRIQKYSDTRTQVAEMESGLSNWLMQMNGEAEHAGAGVSMSAKLPSTISAQTGSQQQPLPRQNLNSSSTNLSMKVPGRTPSGKLGGPPQPGAQVGVKSKEFLHAAGAFGNKGMKSGMKLFSKGKSKLRDRAGEKS